MRFQASALMTASVLFVALAACNPASPPDDALPSPVVPPSTAAAAAVETTVAVQSANPSLSPQGQPLENPVSCREEIGEPAASRLVERCITVSPATRPPCNAANTCVSIQNEIKRGCDFFEESEKPAECAA